MPTASAQAELAALAAALLVLYAARRRHRPVGSAIALPQAPEAALVAAELEQAEAKVAELQAELADPDVYADTDRVVDLQSKHDAAKDEAARLMGEWEQAATRLEASTP